MYLLCQTQQKRILVQLIDFSPLEIDRCFLLAIRLFSKINLESCSLLG